MIPVKFVVVLFQNNLQFMFIIWRILFLKKMKLFCQFVAENFGDLVMSIFLSNLGRFWT
jgi:hypothetical protein